ncbi:MAG: hypothetical protein EOS22_04785 [Mesorhizobium sp.]|uniref:hypothetical protein n=1 Tax=Mesorhizobium sp. TaxID=1871066 RepID=UPI000FE47B76|nr:hypothetical protein [Mesorhizobium sp.]RWD31340.1 MAG: hypothetical protein EOS22_04785 [Mesorhizobium sp.]TJW70746.1 MAG: hypothetical protein E5V29_03280 [Mesorhizobium sp.]
MKPTNPQAKMARVQKQKDTDQAARVLRSLARAGVIPPDNPVIVPAAPGCSVISLMPLSDGSFDRERVLKEPVVAWRVHASRYAEPIIPGLPVTDRWAVLTPEGFVMTDEYTNLIGDAAVSLKDWIHFEIEWLESENGGRLVEFPTACRWVFEYSGPLAKALGNMMAGRREWVGTSHEMLETLSKFRGDAPDSTWPSGPTALMTALKALETKLAIADLFVIELEDGRLLVNRADAVQTNPNQQS